MTNRSTLKQERAGLAPAMVTTRPVGALASTALAPTGGGDFHRLRVRLYFLLITADVLLMAFGFMAANPLRPYEPYGLTTFALVCPVFLAVSLNNGAYSIAALADPRRSSALAMQALGIALVVATFLFFSLKIGEDFSRVVFTAGSVLAFLAVAVGRRVIGRALGRRYGWTFRREVLLVDNVEANPTGVEVVIHAGREGLRPCGDDPEMLARLGRILDRCERVILACPPDRRAAWSRILAGANVDVEILVPELETLGAIGLRRHGDHPSLIIGGGPLSLRERALKRSLDLVVSAAALLFLAPLLLLVAAAIRIESPGPALFRQARMGRGNRLFPMLKFRTMRLDAADLDGIRSASPEDERVTRIGRLLRRTSLDELPQLLNVLKGDMSIVGPRPHALGSTAEDSPFWSIDDHYWDRHAIRPGMTGLAQVRGLRGATELRTDLTDRLASDLEYLDGWSVGRDVRIMFRTLGVLIHRNAY